jgi:hypothetical protein
VERHHGLAGREQPQGRHADLDHEAAARFQVRCGVAKAVDLGLLAGQVHDRVEHQVGQPERRVQPGAGEVADGHLDGVAAGFGPQPGHHGRRQVDAGHLDPAGSQRQRDPPGADAQLQRAAGAGQFGQQVDGRVDHGRREHLGFGVVVVGRHRLVEVVHQIGHARRR